MKERMAGATTLLKPQKIHHGGTEARKKTINISVSPCLRGQKSRSASAISGGSRILVALALASCGEVVVEPKASSGAGGGTSSTSTTSSASTGQGGSTTTSAGQGGSATTTSAGPGGMSAGGGGAGGAPCSPMDADGDGWSACDGDCCDAQSPLCGDEPALVNPGAIELLNNGIDDDCDATTDDLTPPAPCSAEGKWTGVTGEDVARALDLCQFTTASPPLSAKVWGVLSTQQLLPDGSAPTPFELADIQNYQTAILTHFGTGGIVPKKGATMAGLSTGRMRDAAAPDYVDPTSGTGFNAYSSPPSVFLDAHGGALPASWGCLGDCPSGVGASDPAAVRLTIRVPTNVIALSYDFKFLSAEYGNGLCSPFNDFFLALLETGAAGMPPDHEISLDALGNFIAINTVSFESCLPKACFTCPQGVAELAGTGLEKGASGGATAWLTTDAPVVPGEIVVLDLMIFDVSDNNVDSMVLLDNFRWKTMSAGPGPFP
jgi:hypothetical protein